ncbi:hypothetical protein [Halalkalibaculum sp. DA384]
MNVELATNERRALKQRGAKNWRGVSALMRWLYSQRNDEIGKNI